jgi:hypothetical protein
MPDDKNMPIKPDALRPDAPAPAGATTTPPPAPAPAPAAPANELVAALRTALAPARDQGAPPPSTEIRAGGKFRVGDRVVDAEGNPIKDEPPE